MPDEDYDELNDEEIMNDLFSDDDVSDDDDPSAGFDPKEIKALKDQISELEKANSGLLKTVQKDRAKRQEATGKLDGLTETVRSILDARDEAAFLAGSNASSDDDILPVEVTEDGDAFIPRSRLEEILAPAQARIDELEQRLQLTNQQQNAAQNAQQLIQSMVGEDERYTPAYSKYQAARKWVNDRVLDWQVQNGETGVMNSGDALDKVFSDEHLSQEFSNAFPGMDLFTVTTAEDSQTQFKRMLKTTADALVPKKEPDARFRQALSKPSGLGKSANAKGGELSLSERVSQLSTMDIMDLSDDQIEALNKYMKVDEQKEGIKF